jgi:hypothetical protein
MTALDLLLILCAWILGAYCGYRYRKPVAVTPEPPTITLPTMTPTEAEAVAAIVRPTIAPRPASEPMVTIRYVSKRGTVLGEQQIPARWRRVSRSFTYGKPGTKGNFQASHHADGVWVYRHSHDDN